MKLFETAYLSDFQCFVRQYDTEARKSSVERVDNRVQYFVPDPNGAFKGFLDPEITYSPKFGTFKDARDAAGACNPVYRAIRERFTSETFNMQPRIWYLDIETRSGERFISSPSTPIYLKRGTEVIQSTIKEAQDSGYTGQYSLNGVQFSDISTAPFMAKTPSFPKPELALHEVTLVQIFDNKENKIYLLGLKDVDIQELRERGYQFPEVQYVKCRDEVTLLTAFQALFKKLDPLVILAWNGEGFDFPYLYNRMQKLGIPGLSNYGEPELKDVSTNVRTKFELHSPGHFFMDFMDVYKKFTFTPQASYSLDSIAEFELKQNKVKHNEFLTFDSFYTGDAYQPADEPYSDKLREEIRQAYLKWQSADTSRQRFKHLVDLQFVLYGIFDVVLLKGIDDKLKLLPLMSKISSIMGVLLSDTLRTVKPWSQYIANEAYKRGQVMPSFQDHEDPSIIGGFVKEPIPGKYSWVMNADINSMYPRLCISAFNMSPETYVPLAKAPPELRDAIMIATDGQDEQKMLKLDFSYQKHLTALLQKYRMSLGINGALFRTEELGLIPELVSSIFFERKKMKKHMLKCYDLVTQISRILEERNS